MAVSPSRALIESVERRRQRVGSSLAAKHRAAYGQFFTPAPVASFIAGLLDLSEPGSARLLDPGAGVGSLSAAVVSRWMVERPGDDLHITAFEIDESLAPELESSLEECRGAMAT